MNTFILACLLCLVCSVVGALGYEGTFPPGPAQVTLSAASGEGLPGAPGEDDGAAVEELSDELSGGADSVALLLHEWPSSSERKRKQKGNNNNKRRNGKSRSRSNTTTSSNTASSTTTAFNPEHSAHTSGFTSPRSVSTTVDPCTSTHLGFCIHGFCKHMEDLQEPVCVCMKGFDGLRCGIQTLETRGGDKSEAELVQTVLVVIAVVLSVISCTAILLMTCAHYRTHKNFMAAYLGTGGEVEKLQKPMANGVV